MYMLCEFAVYLAALLSILGVFRYCVQNVCLEQFFEYMLSAVAIHSPSVLREHTAYHLLACKTHSQCVRHVWPYPTLDHTKITPESHQDDIMTVVTMWPVCWKNARTAKMITTGSHQL